MALLQSASSKISELWELRDKRLDGWPLMSSPIPSILITFGYLFSVKVIGPKFMENRPAYQLRGVMMIYNVYQVAFNAWLFYEGGRFTWFSGKYSLICQPVDYSNDPDALRVLRAGYLFYMSKFVDLFDTVFFVLRKKNNQVTSLHIFHHGLLPVSLWPGVRYACGGHGSFFAFINSFVHVVMYFYYFMAALGPQYQKYLGWKKYLTSLQIAQFIAVGIHCFQLIFIECEFPIIFTWLIGSHAVIFFFLFSNFYTQSYKQKQGKDERRKEHVKKN